LVFSQVKPTAAEPRMGESEWLSRPDYASGLGACGRKRMWRVAWLINSCQRAKSWRMPLLRH